jgi:hypothetical protein
MGFEILLEKTVAFSGFYSKKALLHAGGRPVFYSWV